MACKSGFSKEYLKYILYHWFNKKYRILISFPLCPLVATTKNEKWKNICQNAFCRQTSTVSVSKIICLQPSGIFPLLVMSCCCGFAISGDIKGKFTKVHSDVFNLLFIINKVSSDFSLLSFAFYFSHKSRSDWLLLGRKYFCFLYCILILIRRYRLIYIMVKMI